MHNLKVYCVQSVHSRVAEMVCESIASHSQRVLLTQLYCIVVGIELPYCHT